MECENLFSSLKNCIYSENIQELSDIKSMILYLKLGDILVTYIKINKLDKNKTLALTFNKLKTVFEEIDIYDIKSVKAIYQLSLDYNRLNIIKELLQQIIVKNKILIVQNTYSIEDKIANIKNSIKYNSYIDNNIDNNTKIYHYHQIEIKKNIEINFIENIKLLTIFDNI